MAFDFERFSGRAEGFNFDAPKEKFDKYKEIADRERRRRLKADYIPFVRGKIEGLYFNCRGIIEEARLVEETRLLAEEAERQANFRRKQNEKLEVLKKREEDRLQALDEEKNQEEARQELNVIKGNDLTRGLLVMKNLGRKSGLKKNVTINRETIL